MIKLKILVMTAILSLISIDGYTNESSVTNILQKINDDMRETRKNEGFNPDGGVTIVTLSNITAPDKVKSQWMKEHFEQKEKGYHSIYSDRAKALIQLQDTVRFKYATSLKNKDGNSSIFRKTISEIAMGYEVTPVQEQYVSELYGFAACNTFKDGWTGIVEFFKTEQVGTCAFTENNVTLTHQAAKIDADVARYDINDKVTVVTIEGNKNSGYLYKVDWFDNYFFRTLECANTNFLNSMTHDVIALAAKIDSK